ncbi:hypothetical protein LIP_0921 [Limnochorda pilosa]|uniref:DUF6259 domain-containing protein n=1 Tax=Limnochorda pilosa TaxID=1555112 RepID=A0A0K2SI48_LIMPI|nr:hypothetical protein LIP_0921 [Limnochorda pilosa]
MAWDVGEQNLTSFWDEELGRELVAGRSTAQPLLELRFLREPASGQAAIHRALPLELRPVDAGQARDLLRDMDPAGSVAPREEELNQALLRVACGAFQASSGETLPLRALAWLTPSAPLPGRRIAEPGELLAWRLAVVNLAEVMVVEVLFPRLPGLALEGDDVLVYPHHAGERIAQPAATLATERYLGLHRAGTVREGGEYVREIPYCGLASMMWMDYHDGKGGVYLASYDPEFLLTGLRVETGGPESPYLRLAFRKYLPIRPGEAWLSPPYALGVHPGDWHWAARRYREWFDTRVPQLEQPADLAEEGVVTPHYDFRREGRVYHRFEEMPSLFDRARRELGSRHLFVSGWNHLGFDNHYPDYNPDLELGTPLDLARGVSAVREAGGFVTFYINSRLIDLESEYYQSLGRRWALRGPDGNTVQESYGPRTFSVLCPADPAWRKHLADFGEWMVTGYGARGIYYDQLGSATPLPCYSRDHGHSPADHHGLFNQGYVRLLDEVLGRLRRHDPVAFLMIENCGDVYSSRVWGNVTWNGEQYDESFDVYRYTFPEHALVCMVQPRPVQDPRLQERLFRSDVGRAFLLGAVFWYEPGLLEQRWIGEGSPESAMEWIQEALAVRKAVASTLAASRLADRQPFDLPRGVQGRLWTPRTEEPGRSREELLLLFNPERVGGKVSLPFPAGREVRILTASAGARASGERAAMDGWRVGERRLRPEAGTMPLPPRRFAACLIAPSRPVEEEVAGG